jgi:hypothetical protein
MFFDDRKKVCVSLAVCGVCGLFRKPSADAVFVHPKPALGRGTPSRRRGASWAVLRACGSSACRRPCGSCGDSFCARIDAATEAGIPNTHRCR